MRFGRQLCGDLDAASTREWLVTDGLGGFAMGTVGGLRTRRYHGLLIVASRPPGGRKFGLAALDPVLDGRVRLAVHEWGSGSVDPDGNIHLASFELEDGLPRWRWQVGDVIVEPSRVPIASPVPGSRRAASGTQASATARRRRAASTTARISGTPAGSRRSSRPARR